MPRGSSAERMNEINKKTRFTAETSVKASKRAAEVRTAQAQNRRKVADYLKELLTEERRIELAEAAANNAKTDIQWYKVVMSQAGEAVIDKSAVDVSADVKADILQMSLADKLAAIAAAKADISGNPSEDGTEGNEDA